MAKFVFKDAHVTLNAVDLSDHVESITINYGADVPEKTSMSENSKTRLPGLKDWSVDISFRQDFASGKVDATMFSLVGAAAFAVVFRPLSDAKSATNPEYTGNGLLSTYSPLAGSVGDVLNAPVTIMGDGDLARGV